MVQMNSRRTEREPTIGAGFARGLIEAAVARGATRDELLARAKIAPDSVIDQDGRIPFSRYKALMYAGQKLANDPALALHFGEAYDFEELSIVGLIGNSCENLGQAMAQLNRYARLVVEVDGVTRDRLVFSRDHDGLWIIDTRENPNAFPEMTESAFARIVSSAHRFAKAELKAVHFTHKEPTYRAEYDRIFQVPITFESGRNALLMVSDEWMRMKPPVPSRYLFGLLSERADALMKQLETSNTVHARVESFLIPILHTGDVGMETIARRMGISRQTLFRRLHEEGTTFEKLLDELRHKMALNYINGGRVSVNEIAYLVGFSQPAAFSRAFKRWTGKSPRSLRKTSP